MVKEKFARKLTDSEVNEYTGPIHYICHREVMRPDKFSTPLIIAFNTSAFQGHSLNDYWMKGPDLLNNLFGVIFRFREKSIALVAYISKMYNRVLIPEVDQHVHRFLWRQFDAEKEPDVYVMSVLPLGDKPAAAMAQAALRKTAIEAKER
ncbi:uncharacterized protein LOC141904340 [Tubulanus polymorphus]|uniref:uncharacterized protein LOC141904340 n=1 Tax=Tubulanus polymorphus TaxID=672921 RepID=UPI003DA692CE